MTPFDIQRLVRRIPDALHTEVVEWSGGATGLDQWLPVFLPFGASWQVPIRNRDRSCPRFPHPLFSSRTASFPRYGWEPELTAGHNPVGVEGRSIAATQGCPFGPTLGFVTQPRCGWGRALFVLTAT
jgi:hypothetical protein